MTTEQISSSPYALRQFVDSCRSPATRQHYQKGLRYFMRYIRIEDYSQLVSKDPKHLQMDICDWISHLRKEGRSFSSISSYLSAVNKFCTMNDIISLNWKKIHSFEGEREKVTEDRPYTHSEIKLLCENTNVRNRAIVLLMSSSGLRVGALPLLRIKDLEPIDKYDIYKITAYPRSRRSRYFSFCTPEARKEIDNYLEWRKRFGEKLEDESPLFIQEQGTITDIPLKSKGITSGAINMIMKRLLRNIGLRTEPIEGQKNTRQAIMQCHGFRKFFETQSFKAGMDNMYLRRLMGQKSGLEDSYLKLSEEELLEGDSKHVGYIGIIDQLTINEENRLKREIQTLRVERSEMELLKQRMEEYDKVLGQFMEPQS